MQTNYISKAERCYTLVGKKKIEEIKNYLHLDVELYSPLAHVKGKKNVLEATSNFMKTFNSLTIRSKFGSDESAIVVYDASLFKQKKEEIFIQK